MTPIKYRTPEINKQNIGIDVIFFEVYRKHDCTNQIQKKKKKKKKKTVINKQNIGIDVIFLWTLPQTRWYQSNTEHL